MNQVVNKSILFFKKTIQQLLHWLPWIIILFFTLQYIRLGITNEIMLRNGLDLGTYTQVLYNINNDNIPPFNTLKNQIAWGDHAHFIMLLLAPVFAIWQDPRTLIIIQVLFVTSAGWALYKIAQDKLKNYFFSFSLLIAYLLFFGIQYALDFDFHANVLTSAVLAWSFYAFHFRKYPLFWFTVIIGFLTREDAALFYAMFGVYIVLFESDLAKKTITLAYSFLKSNVFAPACIAMRSIAGRSEAKQSPKTNLLSVLKISNIRHLFNLQSTQAVILIIISLAYFFTVTYILMPKWTPGGGALTYFDAAGTQKGPAHLLVWFISHPIGLIKEIFVTDTNRNTIRQIFQSFGFVSLFSPITYLMLAPNFVARFMSEEYQRHLMSFHYNASLASILAYSAILGTSNLKRFFARLLPKRGVETIVVLLMAIAILAGTYYSSWKDKDLPLHKLEQPEFTETKYQPVLSAGALDIIKQMIPKNKSVSAASGLVPQLSTRQYIYNFPDPLPKQTQWVVLSAEFNTWPLHKGEMLEAIEKYKADPDYETIWQDYGIFAFKKKNNKPL